MGKVHLGDLGKGRIIMPKWILGKEGVRMWTGFIWLKLESNGGLM
jgi:hypothetical protein